MPVAAPADKRFRRAHVTPTRKRRPWWGHGWPILLRAIVLLALGGYGAYRGAALVLSADVLTITRLTVDGNVRMSKGEVVALLDGLRGRNMVTVDLDEWRRKLLSSPWVAEAALRRVLPGTVHIAISERQPIGLGRLGHELYLVDHRGRVIDEYGPNYAEFDLPVIDGLASPPRTGGPLVDEARAALAARLLAALQARPDLARRVSQIDVSDVRDAVVMLKDDTTLVRLGDDQFTDRLQSYLDLAPALRERVENIDYVDLRFDERVYVKPQPSGVRARRTTGGGN